MAVFHVDRSSGKAAIYTGTDDAPLSDPYGNLSRVRFHTDFEYPSIVAEVTATISLPSLAANSIRSASYTVAAHGQSGIPWVIGTAKIGYVSGASYVAGTAFEPLTTSTPMGRQLQGSPFNYYTTNGRVISIGADSTNIILHELAESINFAALIAESVEVKVYVTSLNMNDSPPAATPTVLMDVNAGAATPYVSFMDDRFDTRKRYILSSSSTELLIPTGPTWATNTDVRNGWTTRFKLGSNDVRFQRTGFASTADPSAPADSSVGISVT